MRVMNQMLRDRQFFWALLIAPLLWLIGYYFYSPTPDWKWPLHQPRELVFLVILYPSVEELLFRGLLQGWLLERANFQRHWQGLTLANLATSVIFTVLHFLMHPPLAAASVLLPSLVFGYFRDRYGRLHAPILLHVYYNLGYFWLFAS
ncbi:MAG TPA: JDVT-CTERM system glutamic-type intramembrane protease [Gammaproteobacteria bacterium]|nr:JDVT-CTERM system glutamic-type intramembrane protease [Gammaproteobacteria bacterium]